MGILRRLLVITVMMSLGSTLMAQPAGRPPELRAIMEKKPFGKMPDGKEVDLYVLSNKNGMVAKIMTLGATLTELHVHDRNKKLADVTLGFDSAEAYLKGHPYFGSTTGRYANRIAKGKFTLDGKDYSLAVNNGPNALHGGLKGFDKVLWNFVSSIDGPGEIGVKFKYVSADGEEGYPGELTTFVTYFLTDKNELRIEYQATTNKATPVNLTNHAYFNLAGSRGKEDILNHELELKCGKFIPTDDTLIPVGKLADVAGTPFDFTKPHKMGERLKEVTPASAKGYDLCYVIDNGGKNMTHCATVYEPSSGRVMEVLTNVPGIQLYTGNFLDSTLTGRGNTVYRQHYGFCLETMHFPDSPNQPSFPSTILKSGETYRQTAVYRFSVR